MLKTKMKILIENFNPMPAPRPRVAFKSGKVWAYKPKEYEEYLNLLVWKIKKQKPKELKGNLGAKCYFYLAKQKGRKPDIDQLIKPLFDASQMAGLFQDDSQIVQLEARIWRDVNKPTLCFEIYEIKKSRKY